MISYTIMLLNIKDIVIVTVPEFYLGMRHHFSEASIPPEIHSEGQLCSMGSSFGNVHHLSLFIQSVEFVTSAT